MYKRQSKGVVPPNSLSINLVQSIDNLVDNISKELKVLVFKSQGKGFCAGADIEDTFQTRIDGKDPGKDTQSGSGGMPKNVDWVGLIRESKPMIAAVNGAAVGIGITMILPFDIIMASKKAKFGMFFIQMGLVPELASSHFLVQRMGFGKASEMCLSGRLVPAKEAMDSNLVDFLILYQLHQFFLYFLLMLNTLLELHIM